MIVESILSEIEDVMERVNILVVMVVFVVVIICRGFFVFIVKVDYFCSFCKMVLIWCYFNFIDVYCFYR